MKNKTVLLLGAGAVVPWGGKTSDELTNILLEKESEEFLTNTDRIPIGKFLKRKIEEYYSGFDGSSQGKNANNFEVANFEHVLEIVEYLFSYYRNKEFTNPIWARPSFPSIFRVENEIDKEIPEEKVFTWEFKNDKNQLKSITLYNLYQNILSRLCNHVVNYSESFGNPKSKEKDSKFCDFINSVSESSILRVYSLNYDNIINQQVGLSKGFFNGFEPENFNKCNYARIISNYDENCFYNLHGSFNFKEKPNNNYSAIDLLFDPDFPEVRRPEHNVELLNTPIIPSQIITGSQKFSKTLIQPLNAFNYTFRNDCYFAQKIIVIGYSFSDAHVNNVLASAMNSNSSLKLKIITRIDESISFTRYKDQLKRAFRIQEDEIDSIRYEDKDCLYSKNGLFELCTRGFLK